MRCVQHKDWLLAICCYCLPSHNADRTRTCTLSSSCKIDNDEHFYIMLCISYRQQNDRLPVRGESSLLPDAHYYRNFHETLGSSEFNPIPSVSSNNVTSFFTRLNEVTKRYCPGLLASFEPGLDSMMPFIPICAFTVPADSSKRRSNIPSTKRLTL